MLSDDELIDLAKGARRWAHAPYSNFSVGATLLSSDGRVFTGCNVENSTYGLSMCAERVAIFKAVSEGAHEIARIACRGRRSRAHRASVRVLPSDDLGILFGRHRGYTG